MLEHKFIYTKKLYLIQKLIYRVKQLCRECRVFLVEVIKNKTIITLYIKMNIRCI